MPVKLKLFTRAGCTKCPVAKALCQKLDIGVTEFDVDTVDGMAEAAFHSVMATPTIVLIDEDDNELASWRGTVPAKETILKAIQESE